MKRYPMAAAALFATFLCIATLGALAIHTKSPVWNDALALTIVVGVVITCVAWIQDLIEQGMIS